uniref:Ig-like domain-containing protein n=1 Tax=Denticeps clupeoides TaxID=299321 RepID=A0AAY4EA50_9TELE
LLYFKYRISFITYISLLSIDVTLPPLRAVVELATGRPELLSGDSFQLTCHVPEEPSPFWSFQWFRNGRLVGNATSYEITKARVQHGGFYTCKGARETELNPQGVMHTLTSPPLKMHVDGGWVILQASTDPMIVQESLILMCRIRGNPIPSEVILYRDGTEILRHHHNILVIPNLTLDDQGMYWCRATWENKGLSQAAQSLAVKVNVLDILTTPVLKAESGDSTVRRGQTLTLKCITEFNTRQTDLVLHYYFFKDDKIMAPATSTGPYWTPGQCPVHRACPGNVPCGLRLPPARLAGACCAL